MIEVTFNEKEIKNIKKTLDLTLDDIREIWKNSELKAIYIWFDMPDEEIEWGFYINDRKIIIYKPAFEMDKSIDFSHQEVILEEILEPKKIIFKKDRKEKVIRNNLETIKSQNYIFRFLSRYEEIRKELISEIATTKKEKEEYTQKIETLRAKYIQEVFIDLGSNESQNARTIEVLEESGQKIGIINFGNKTLKIITYDDIILTKKEKTKQKIK